MKSLFQLAQKLYPKQTHTQTHTHDENITSTGYAGGNEFPEITQWVRAPTILRVIL